RKRQNQDPPMSWLVDNANSLYLLLGIIAAALVLAWRFNQRAKFLGYAAGVLVLMGLVWLLTHFVPSDRRQLEMNVNAMAEAVIAGKMDDLFQHISRDFRYKDMTRDMLFGRAKAAVEAYKVRAVKITKFKVEELDRTKKFARTSFRVSAWWDDNE